VYALGTRPLAQYAGAWEYLLPDALGSVRQIVDANGNVTLAESYEPYGSVLNRVGTASSIFGYSGEQIDTYIKLLFLRARYYAAMGRFISADTVIASLANPQSLHRADLRREREHNTVCIDNSRYKKRAAIIKEMIAASVLSVALKSETTSINRQILPA
jgi:RHS repeat-associated protein